VGDSLVEKKAVNSNGLTAFFIITIDSVSPATDESQWKSKNGNKQNEKTGFLTY